MTLYSITNDIRQLTNYLEMVDDETPQEILEELARIKSDLKRDFGLKIDGICKAIINYDADIDTIDNEIKRLRTLKAKKESAKDSLKEYTKECMYELGISKAGQGVSSLTVCKKVAPIIITGEVPDKYKRVKTTIETNLSLIRQDLKSGELSDEELNKFATVDNSFKATLYLKVE